MGRSCECYYQTKLDQSESALINAVRSEAYWIVEDKYASTSLQQIYFLLKFKSLKDREMFRKEFTDRRILGPRTFCVKMGGGWKDVSYICVTKAPERKEIVKKRKGNLSYKLALRDILAEYESMNGQYDYMNRLGYGCQVRLMEAASKLDEARSRVKHAS